jgi:hypothetical protein
MGGYAIMAPAALGGPPGWVVWAVGGTILTVGGLFAAKKVYDATRPKAIPNTDADTCENCKRPYSITVHAQGTDCGGTTGSTIGAPSLVSVGVPFPAAAGVALAEATWGVLTKTQKKVRTIAKAKMQVWILGRPPSGYLGQKTFMASDPSGGKRYDTDSYGPSPNYIT